MTNGKFVEHDTQTLDNLQTKFVVSSSRINKGGYILDSCLAAVTFVQEKTEANGCKSTKSVIHKSHLIIGGALCLLIN